jgi:HK97 family phage prohead protease
MKKETRAIKGIEVREAPEGSSFIGVLEGYGAVFDSESVEFASRKGPWVERIERGAFAQSLVEQPDVKALWSHRSDAIIGRTPDTLTLSEDERGLRAEIRLVDTQLNRDLIANINGGLVDAMSFGFEVERDEWVKGETRDTRVLKQVRLYEVSPVVFPAYPDTAIAVRSHEEFLLNVAEAEKRDDAEQSVNAPCRALWEATLGIQTNK